MYVPEKMSQRVAIGRGISDKSRGGHELDTSWTRDQPLADHEQMHVRQGVDKL